MSIYYGSRVIGDIEPAGLHGHAGLGVSQLRFSVNWNIHPKRDAVFSIFGTSIWVSARPESESEWRMLGHAIPETAWSDESRDGEPFKRPLLYRVTLADAQLLAIENARKGRGMSFQLEVRGHLHGPDGIRSLASTVMLAVNPSDWVRILKEANATEVLLVGVHLPVVDSKNKCRAAIDLARKAHDLLLHGHYEHAIAQCRLSIESLWKAMSLVESAREARKMLANMNDRKAMTKLDRELALGEALLNFTHPAHHVGLDAQPEIFGRLDAALVVASTVGLVSSIAAAPERLLLRSTETGSVVATTPVANPATPTPKNAQTPTLAVQVARARENLASNRPRTLKSLRTAAHSWFGKKLDPKQLDSLMAELKRLKVFVETNGKLTYPDLKQ